jgi:hypothetical protein
LSKAGDKFESNHWQHRVGNPTNSKKFSTKDNSLSITTDSSNPLTNCHGLSPHFSRKIVFLDLSPIEKENLIPSSSSVWKPICRSTFIENFAKERASNSR